LFRGLRLHQVAEDFVLGKTDVVGKELAHCRNYLQSLKDKGGIPEMGFNFRADWGETEFEDKEGGMIRGKIDLIVPPVGPTVQVEEYKTGKVYQEHAKQRSLYGLAALLKYPGTEEAAVTTVYFDQKGENTTTVVKRTSLVGLQRVWERHVKKVQPPQDYPMRPSFKCRWCNFSKNNGGRCPN
jgi:hypothetical protein